MRARHIVGAVAAGLLGLVAVVPSVSAGEAISGGTWSGSALEPGPTSVEVGRYQLSGTFRRTTDFQQVGVTIFAVPGRDGPCTIASVVVPEGDTPRSFAAVLTIPCNGTYTLNATALTKDNPIFPRDAATLDRTVKVSAPAPDVTGLTVEAADDKRSMTLAWDDMRHAAPDLAGYVVERQVDDEPYEVMEVVDPAQTGYADHDLPSEAGEVRYRVSSTRPTPDGEVTSQSSEGEPTPFAGTSDTGGDGTGADHSAGSGGPDEEGVTADDTSPATKGGRSSASRNRGGFSSSFPSALLRPSAQPGRGAGGPTTTVDGGFDEELHYAAEPGEPEPVLPDDAMASILSEPRAGRGLAIPLATGLVLAVWAFHLRRLAAAAARPMA